MVSVVQLVERQIVVLVVVGSSPTVHPPKKQASFRGLFFLWIRHERQIVKCAESGFYHPKTLRKIHQRIVSTRIATMTAGWQRALYSPGTRFLKKVANANTETYGIISTRKALYLNAAAMSPFRREWTTRCEPQPGQRKPVSCRKMHLGNRRLDSGLVVA